MSKIREDKGEFIARYRHFIVPIPFSGCFIWTGATNGKYGILSYYSRKEYAHRACYLDYFSAIPSGKEICHHCDEPLCVNPRHLFAGTRSDNVNDMILKGRANTINSPRGEHHGMAKLTEGQVINILSMKGKVKATKIAKRYNMHPKTIRKIFNKQLWKSVLAHG